MALVPIAIAFPNTNRALALRCPPGTPGDAIVTALRLPRPRAILKLIGGAGELPQGTTESADGLLDADLTRMLVEEAITILDSGTQAGLIDLRRVETAAYEKRAPVIGVCPEAQVTWPEDARDPKGDRLDLEPHHTHFVLAAGDQWGDEVGEIFTLLESLGRGLPQLALLARGGEGARREVLAAVRHDVELLVIAGSGGLADAIAAAVGRDPATLDEDLREIVTQGCLAIFNVAGGPRRLAAMIRRKLVG